MSLRINSKFLMLVMAVFAVAGCGGAQDSRRSMEQAPEYVPGEGDELSPLEAHLRARGMVNPSDKNSSRYTYQGGQPHDDYYSRLKGGGQTDIDAQPLEAPEHQQGYGGAVAASVMPQDSAPQNRTGRITSQTRVPKPGFKPLTPQHMASAPVMDEIAVQMAEAPPTPPRRPQGSLREDDMQAPAQEAREFSRADTVATGVRLGEYPGRTRVVIDLNGQTNHSYKVDNAAHVLRIELPGVAWGIEKRRTFRGHPFFSSFIANELPGGGTVLDIQLKHAVKVDKAVALPPNETYGHRVYFDVTGG